MTSTADVTADPSVPRPNPLLTGEPIDCPKELQPNTNSGMDSSASDTAAGVIVGNTFGKESQTATARGRHGGKPKEEVGWRRVIRNFTPSWFAVNMGTGIVSILMHQLPYNAEWLQYVSIVFFLLNVALFSIFLAMTILRYALYPEIWTVMINHSNQSLFIGTFPMGLATIINMTVLVCSGWGAGMVYFAWALWWLDVVISLLCCTYMPFVVMQRHNFQLRHATAALLLPVVPAVVASATGGLVAEVLPNPDHAVTTLVVSYILWGIGESFSALILAIYFQRLHIHHLPPREAIVSVFLPVGPLGQGGFAIQQLGRVALTILPKTEAFGPVGVDPMRAGEVFYALGVFLAFVMWGAGVGWLAFALISIATTQSFPFNMGWWGFTFPLGVFTTCTGLLGEDLSSTFFKVLTTIFSASVFILWLVVAVRTLIQAITGEIFLAPCLQDLRPKAEQDDSDRTV